MSPVMLEVIVKMPLLLTLWREAATECSSGPSKSTIVDIVDVAEVVEIEK
jgi:hypothetical protein